MAVSCLPLQATAGGTNWELVYFRREYKKAGKDKWEQTQLERMKFLSNNKWNGKQYSLKTFTGYHRSAYIQLQEAAEHVNFQLPTEHSRVGYLINNIENPDPDLCAALQWYA